MKAPLVVTFCHSPQLSRHVGLNIFNVIKSVTFHCFLQLWEQEEVTRSKVRGVERLWERRNVVFREKFICGDSPVGWGVIMVQDPVAGVPLLRAMSAHSVAKALRDCFVEFLIYRLSSVEEMMMCSTARTFVLFPGHTRNSSICHQWLPRTWIWDRFGLDHGRQCKFTRNHPSVPLLGDGAQILLSHISFPNLKLEFSGTYRMLFWLPLRPLW